jgi:hypothetical protein
LGLSAGPVPPRLEAAVKAGLLTLIDHARGRGWSARRACLLLGLAPDRAAGWRIRSRSGRLADLPCGGGAVHGLLDSERVAVVELFEAWAGVDRTHRKLAARGSRLDLVHVSASTMHRVLNAEGLVLQRPAAREPAVRAPWPEWIVWKPNRPDSSTTPSGCTPASATSPPTTSTTAAAKPSAKPAATASPRHDTHASNTVEPKHGTHHDRAPIPAGYFLDRTPD